MDRIPHFPKPTDPARAAINAALDSIRRDKGSRASVLWADRAASWTITVGGILVILAVLGIMVFLLVEVMPLFRGGRITEQAEFRMPGLSGDPAGLYVDEYKTLALRVSTRGELDLFHARTGTRLQAPDLGLAGAAVTAFSATVDGRQALFGCADGSIRFATLNFQAEVVDAAALPPGLAPLAKGDATDGRAVYSPIPEGRRRKLTLAVETDDPVPGSAAGLPVVHAAYRVGGEAERQSRSFVVLDAGGNLALSRASTTLNLLTGKKRTQVTELVLPPLPAGSRPQRVLLAEKGDQVFVADARGLAHRYAVRGDGRPVLAESVRVLPEGVELTAFEFLFGSGTLLVGGGNGSLTPYYFLRKDGAGSVDGMTLVGLPPLQATGPAPVFLAPSRRDKSFAVADAAGAVRLLHGTSRKTLLEFSPAAGGDRGVALALAPRMDGLLYLSPGGEGRFVEFSAPHPETTWRTLFGKVWYEGYPEPTFTWQSTGGTDEFEPKLSLVPLIFGTVKATVYSLLFAAPLAILAAIFTSEFMHHRVRGVVKPLMEMMASLPSVVLGFVAALVLAPVVEQWIAAVLLAFVGLPLALVSAAYLWQLLPQRLALRWEGAPKLAAMSVLVPAALAAVYAAGPAFESLFFAGDFKAWVNGGAGRAMPFLFLLLLPLCILVSVAACERGFGRRLTRRMRSLRRERAALWDLARWGAVVALSLSLSLLLASLLESLGVDARGGLVDTYVQRNTLVVGFAMGFAVIPIIYTLAEDALNAAPEHLRAASLGCGGTPWQTALYVILPTAVSGVFAAVMIGMGRAVGETMIVVMSAGNTPIMDWNVFNGLRALSATIAVELPEAVKDGTLYRVLFLAGLVLFAMTFLINTAAEMVRQHFRKRTSQL